MKKILLATTVGLIFTGHALAGPITSGPVNDDYIGANATHASWSNQDVIGEVNDFGIQSMTVTQDGSQFTFDVATSFSGKAGEFFGSDIGYGDLFLSSAWSPNGTETDKYNTDNALNGTLWTYALVMDDSFGATGGNLSLYKLNGTNAENALLSQDLMEPTNNIYRENQEVKVDTNSDTVENLGVMGSWSLTDGLVSMGMNLSGTGLLDSDSLAFHWTMYCGNDVIEGQVPMHSVAEPGTLALLGLGIAGLWAARRRMKGKSTELTARP